MCDLLGAGARAHGLSVCESYSRFFFAPVLADFFFAPILFEPRRAEAFFARAFLAVALIASFFCLVLGARVCSGLVCFPKASAPSAARVITTAAAAPAAVFKASAATSFTYQQLLVFSRLPCRPPVYTLEAN